ncbi:MAG: T9SS type A sorting domain-containing protein [Bacteroidetes bacterium]|nr:T9SS type A sorting domain-containing protein [Bacteroidota bacterium]
MKKQIAKYWFASALSLISLQTIGFAHIQNPDSATVTFKVNTAFVQDTLSARSTVSIRGTAFGGDGSLNNGIKLKSAGGDYWEAQKRVPVGPSGGTFKIATVTQTGTGWDRHVVNEFEITGDTTITYFTTGLKEMYTDPVTGTEITRSDNWNPLEISKAGTTGKIAIHFRVNMLVRESFNSFNNPVQVRGNFNNWDGSTTLYPEVRHDDFQTSPYDADRYFFSRTVLVPDSLSGKQIVYKFTYTDPATQWESLPDRTFILNTDTTIQWKYWDNLPYTFCGIPDDKVVLNYSVDLNKAILTNGFNRLTDTLYVKAGMGNTAEYIMVTRLAHPLAGNVFSGISDSIFVKAHNPLFYSYFKRNADGEFEEFYMDHFDSTGVVAGPKYRKVLINELNKTYQVEDKLTDPVSTHRQPFWKNYNKVGKAVLATFEVNINPARFFTKVIGGTLNDFQGGPVVITGENIDSFTVYINGPATNTTNSWLSWNETDLGLTRQLNDEGINGDAIKGDHIWTIQYLYPAEAFVSQEFRFGIKGADNEGGTGFNHIYNLIADAQNIYKVQFGDIDPYRYFFEDCLYWDFTIFGYIKNCYITPHVENQFHPNKISLSAYPNPFNPATLISYSIPQSGKVSLKVFDLLGRQVAILAEEIKPAGTHQIPFRGDELSSGIYIVRMESGTKAESVKVILLK